MGGTAIGTAQLLCFLFSGLKDFLQGPKDLPIAWLEEFLTKQKPFKKGVVAENIKSAK